MFHKPNLVMAVVGAQYGSEGKGALVEYLAPNYDCHVRTGGPNAGHTIYHLGDAWKMQTIPCGWINPQADLVIGPGAVLSPENLLHEVATIEHVYGPGHISGRLHIDPNAGILDLTHQETEGHTGGTLHQRIGSTGEGVGAARLGRIGRDPNCFRLASRVPELAPYVHRYSYIGRDVLLEGTQGSGLSLVHGPWPYCTSADTNAAQLCADAGIGPRHLDDVVLVARTYPIRVAGNSGPLAGEMSWDELSNLVGRPVLEKTTVTKKVRRVGAWDDELFDAAVRLNSPTVVALMFADYYPDQRPGSEQLSATTLRRITHIETTWGVPVRWVGTGRPDHYRGVTVVERV